MHQHLLQSGGEMERIATVPVAYTDAYGEKFEVEIRYEERKFHAALTYAEPYYMSYQAEICKRVRNAILSKYGRQVHFYWSCKRLRFGEPVLDPEPKLFGRLRRSA